MITIKSIIVNNLLRLIAVVLIFGSFASSFAQIPQAINYQAVVRDNSGSIMPNKAVALKLTIRQGNSSGNAIYQERHAVTSNQLGMVNLAIGRGAALSGTFANIDWSLAPFFLEVALDVNGGTNYVVMGTQELISVPYALYAKRAEEHQTLSINGNQLSISNGNSVNLPTSGGGSGGVFEQNFQREGNFFFIKCTSEPGVDSFLAVFSAQISNISYGYVQVVKKDPLTGAYQLFYRGGSFNGCNNGVFINSATTHRGELYINIDDGCSNKRLTTPTTTVTYDVQPSNSNGIIFSDGQYLYVNNNSNYLKYTAAGNQLTLVSTLTFTPPLNNNVTSVLCDGSYIYALSSVDYYLLKYTLSGAFISRTEISPGAVGLVNIDASKIYLAFANTPYSNNSVIRAGFTIKPISKP
ncbi:MAG: hypothetical protein U0T84_12560 [Chitinophagales bacterium]